MSLRAVETHCPARPYSVADRPPVHQFRNVDTEVVALNGELRYRVVTLECVYCPARAEVETTVSEIEPLNS